MYREVQKGGLPDARVICLDEFGPLEIRPQPGHQWSFLGKPAKRRATYRRLHGVRNLHAALDLKDNVLLAHNKIRKRTREHFAFLKYLRRRYPLKERLYIIEDNLSTHHNKLIKKWARKNRVSLVFTPTNASWLNHIECHFAPLKEFVISGSDYNDHQQLAAAIRHYLRWRNANAKALNLVAPKKKSKHEKKPEYIKRIRH